MAFFKPTPGIDEHEKARIEFHLQQIGECLGSDMMKAPVLDPNSNFMNGGEVESLDSILQTVARHLDHDVDELKVKTKPQELKKCGSGG